MITYCTFYLLVQYYQKILLRNHQVVTTCKGSFFAFFVSQSVLLEICSCAITCFRYTRLYTESHYWFPLTKKLYRHQSKNVVIYKNLPVKGLCGRCSSEFIDWIYSQSCLVFSTQLVNCFPSNLFSGSSLPSFPHSLCEKVYSIVLFTELSVALSFAQFVKERSRLQ